MQIIRYTPAKAQEWDAIVKGSRNGTLLFLRAYMDYHSDRFTDHSLMYYSDKGRLLAVMAANERDGALYSHQGLTYGGFIVGNDIRSAESMELFDVTIAYLRENGFTTWYYKPVPTVYQRCPTEEDGYWLWRNGAVMVGCNLSCSVLLQGDGAVPMERRRRRGIRKAEDNGYTVESDADLKEFWPIMIENLKTKYSAAPVHTLGEMQLLQSRLPQYIECYICRDRDGVAQAGAVVYLANSQAVHVQYAHATPKGKDDGAIDLLYASLMDRYRGDGFRYFDIGTSNEDGGRILNEKLIAQKEGFGGRGIVYRQYKIEI